MCKFLVAICWWLICAVAAPPSAFAFAPQPKFIIRKNADGIHSSISHPLHSTAATIATDEEQSLQQQQQQDKETEISYSSILKAIDNDAYLEATQSCSYLVSESPDAPQTSVGKSVADKATYYSPSTPILSTVAVSSLRNAAQLYFNNRRNNEMNNNENNNGGAALGVERVDLDNLLSSNQVVGDILSELNNVLAQSIYPIIRSGWSAHNALSSTSSTSSTINDNQQQSEQPEQSPVLTVSSASIFANGGYPSAKPSMTTFERDAGLFVVHIDLGNVENHDDDANNEVMGGLFVESLINDNDKNNISTSSSGSLPIVGPLLPGQVIIHESVERTAAISVPSNIHELEEVDSSSSTTLATKFSVDCKSRNEIIKAAENARHYALRLVVTTKHQTNNQEDGEDNNSNNIPKVSSEERSYRLRSYARFQEDRAKYVTLAGLLDPLSYENYLWLGFDYITRMGEIKISTKDDLYQQLSAVNKAVYHLEKAAKLCDTDSRVYFQLASARKAKMECEKQLLGEGDIDMDMDETLYLTQMANELECSAHFESAAVRAGVNDIQDLTICLNALASTHARMKQFDKTLHVIARWAECGSIRSRLAIEKRDTPLNNLPSYEYIQTPNEKNVAVRTVGEKPVLSEEDIAMLVGAADKRFAIAAGIQTSRYTMQYEGNSEVHLDDLCAGDPILKTKIDTMLQAKIYPLVRATIAKEADGQKPPLGPLCVYDSILVRYNGEKAKAAGRVGASQPLVSSIEHVDEFSSNAFSLH